MINSDKQQFHQLMLGVGETYGKKITEPLMDIYFNSLQGYEIDDVTKAFSAHLVCAKHGTFFPKPADLVRIMDIGQPSTEERAELVWMTIEKKISSIGAYGTLKLDDLQALAAVKSLGSWRDLCHTDIDKLQWKRKEFIAAYANFENTPIEALPHHLAGMIEADRTKKASDKPAGFLSAMKKQLEVK